MSAKHTVYTSSKSSQASLTQHTAL